MSNDLNDGLVLPERSNLQRTKLLVTERARLITSVTHGGVLALKHDQFGDDA